MPPQATKRQDWLDVTRGIAMAWVFLVHVVEGAGFGCPGFGNPGSGWGTFAERIAQIRPLETAGIRGLLLNTLRYVGWLGDMGVQIFLVCCGFGLAWSALNADRFTARDFYLRRLMRILPSWWMAHLLVVPIAVVLKDRSLGDYRIYASFLGFRFIPNVLYDLSAAWWYVGLLLQLYLVFPLLTNWLRRWSLARFVTIVGGLSLLLRLIGLVAVARYLPSLLDYWSRGGLFISRLSEFTFGMAGAAAIYRYPATAEHWLRGARAKVSAIVLVVVGTCLLFSLIGMAFGFLLTGVGISLLVYACAPIDRGIWRPVAWLGRNSLSFFLVHYSVVRVVVPTNYDHLASTLIRILLAFVLSVILGQALSVSTEWVVSMASSWYRHRGAWGIIGRLGLCVAVLSGLAVLGEFAVARFDPQEVRGWGERPSFETNDRYGYRLIPNKTTRLRWLSYDYLVRANDLGFPGPHYLANEAPDSQRIMVTGDAFESAEGVDTEASWPRRLEDTLRAQNVDARVSNFSISGWGPQQYSAVVRDFASVVRPKIILVGLFVNDYSDVRITHEEFRKSIGFHLSAQNGLVTHLRLSHLRSYLRGLLNRTKRAVKGERQGNDAFFGYFAAIDRANADDMLRGAVAVKEHLQQIKVVAEQVGAKVMVVQVPAPAQVCDRGSVDWFPRKVDLSESIYDLDQPQRLTNRICAEIGLETIDLRPPMKVAGKQNLCQPRNLHWTAAGHRAVSDFIAQELARRGAIQ